MDLDGTILLVAIHLFMVSQKRKLVSTAGKCAEFYSETGEHTKMCDC